MLYQKIEKIGNQVSNCRGSGKSTLKTDSNRRKFLWGGKTFILWLNKHFLSTIHVAWFSICSNLETERWLRNCVRAFSLVALKGIINYNEVWEVLLKIILNASWSGGGVRVGNKGLREWSKIKKKKDPEGEDLLRREGVITPRSSSCRKWRLHWVRR